MINHPYCQGRGIPHGGACLSPKTVPERLDAAENGEQFKNVLMDLFSALDEARAETDE